jgi:hypothetical protein
MLSNLTASARAAIVGVIDPDAYAAGTVTTGWIDIQDYFTLLGVIFAGDLGSSATVDAKFQQATDSSGTGVKDVTGSAITQLTQAGTDDNKQALINLSSADLDYNNGFRYVRLSMTVATATSDAGAVVIGLDPRYGAANAADASTVDEIVS